MMFYYLLFRSYHNGNGGPSLETYLRRSYRRRTSAPLVNEVLCFVTDAIWKPGILKSRKVNWVFRLRVVPISLRINNIISYWKNAIIRLYETSCIAIRYHAIRVGTFSRTDYYYYYYYQPNIMKSITKMSCEKNKNLEISTEIYRGDPDNFSNNSSRLKIQYNSIIIHVCYFDYDCIKMLLFVVESSIKGQCAF